MQGDAFKKAVPGQPLNIPARAYNAWNDLVKQAARNTRWTGAPKLGSIGPSAHSVWVLNDSGDDVSVFGVLGIEDPVILPGDNQREFTAQIALRCVSPAEGDSSSAGHRGKFVICAEPIGDGKIGQAFISGVCVCRIEDSEATGDFVEIIDGETGFLAVSSSGSARIFWKGEGASGEHWAVVRMGDAGDGLIPVRLSDPSGSAGVNKVSACTFVYTVSDLAETVQFGTAVELTGNGNGWRGLKVALTAGTYGWGYWDAGEFVLLFVDEKPAGEQDCS